MNITIFLPMSRYSRYKRMIEMVNSLEVGKHNINVLAIIDNSRIPEFETKYPTRCVSSRMKPTAEMNMPARRKKIADIFNLARKYISNDCDYVFTIEDDTEIDKDAMLKLVHYYNLLEVSGLISGLQVGRWGFRMLGAWKRISQNTVETLDFSESKLKRKVVEPIDAAGFYCFLTSQKNFCETEYRTDYFGPDVCFGFDLRDKGLKSYVCWDVVAGHSVENERVLYPDENVVKLVFNRLNDRWIRTV